MRKRVQKAFATILSFQLALGYGLLPSAIFLEKLSASERPTLAEVVAQSVKCVPSSPPKNPAAWAAKCQRNAQAAIDAAQKFDEANRECDEIHARYDGPEMATYMAEKKAANQLVNNANGADSAAAIKQLKGRLDRQSKLMDKTLKSDRRQCIKKMRDAAEKFFQKKKKYNKHAYLRRNDSSFQIANHSSSVKYIVLNRLAKVWDIVVPSANASEPIPPAGQIPGDADELANGEIEEEETLLKEDEGEKEGLDKNAMDMLLPLLAIAGLAAAMMGGKDDEEPPQQTPPEEDDEEIECADGEVANEDGTACIADADAPCEAEGMERNEAGVCVVADGRCNADQYPDDQGVCIDKPTCEEGEYFNRDVRACIAKTCPTGQILQADGSCKDDGDETIKLADPDATPANGDDTEFASGDDGEGEAGLSEDGSGGSLGAAGSAGSAGSSGSGSEDGSSGRGFGGFRASGRSPAGAGGAGGGYGGGFGSDSRNAKKGKGGQDAKTIQRFLKWKNPVVHKTLQEAASER